MPHCRAALWAAFAFLGLLCAGAPAWAQGAVQQFGAVTRGHLSMYLGNGRIVDAGGPTMVGGTPPNQSLPGTLPSGVAFVNPGQALAFYSGYATAAYSEGKFGFDGAGNFLIRVDGVGTTPSFGLQVNGINYPFPGAVSGLPQIATNSALQSTPTATYAVAYRAGFYNAGDGGGAVYVSSASPCSLNSGNGDNGSQVKPSTGTGCWLADFGASGGYASVRAFGAVGNGTAGVSGGTNDTAAINAALASCKNVIIPQGRFVVTSRLLTCPGGNQHVVGNGPDSVVQVNAVFSPAADDGVFVNNTSVDQTSLSDKYLFFRDFTIDMTVTGTVGKGIWIRGAQFVMVNNLVCIAGSDCTAMTGSKDTWVVDSVANGTQNAGFDHWNSPQNAYVTNTTTYCKAGTGYYGILFNSANTNLTTDGNGVNFTAIGNRQIGCTQTGIYVSPLTAGGTIKGVYISDNFADPQNAGGASGIAVHGDTQNGRISGAVAQNVNNSWALVIATETGKTPSNIAVDNPVAINVNYAAGEPFGIDGIGHRLSGAKIIGGSFAYAVEVNAGSGSPAAYIEGSLPAGTSGTILDNGVTKSKIQQNTQTGVTVINGFALDANGDVSITAPTAAIPFTVVSNLNGALPPSAFGFAMGTNFSPGQSEVDIINVNPAAPSTLHVYQMTGPGASTRVYGASLDGLYVGPGSQLATNATKPFIYLSASAGQPTGVPSIADAGKIPCEYDVTNHKLWCYDQPAAAWRGVVLN